MELFISIVVGCLMIIGSSAILLGLALGIYGNYSNNRQINSFGGILALIGIIMVGAGTVIQHTLLNPIPIPPHPVVQSGGHFATLAHQPAPIQPIMPLLVLGIIMVVIGIGHDWIIVKKESWGDAVAIAGLVLIVISFLPSMITYLFALWRFS